jgi:cell division protein ZipA
VDLFRWILLLLGAAIVGGIFAFSKGFFSFRRSAPAESIDPVQAEPDELQPAIEPLPSADAEDPLEVESPVLTSASLVITVRLMPEPGKQFPAGKMVLALREAGLKHGKYGIFHQLDADTEQRIRYSAASLVEPGSFDLSNLKDSFYSGISLFMVLPAPEDGVELFDDMLVSARKLVKLTDGRLFDEQGGALSVQRERYMREEVIDFLRKNSRSPAEPE